MGRVKLKIKRLENTNGRQATYAKRKHGIIKKATELSILCDIDILLLMFSPTGKPALCNGKHGIEEVIAKFALLTPQERAKRKLESLEALKKTFKKLDHEVNIQDFLGSSTQTIEDLTNQSRSLQSQLADMHKRLSYWSNPDKVTNLEHLAQMEDSIRDSLNQIQTHKENLGKQQEQQLMSLECNGQFQNGMNLPYRMGVEQQLQPMSWVPNNENQHLVLPEDPNLLQHRDLECSASSSFGSYPGYFSSGKNSEMPNSGQENGMMNNLSTTASLRLQLGGQYPYMPYNLHMLGDQKFQQASEMALQENAIGYHLDGNFDATRSGFDPTHQDWAPTSGASAIAMFEQCLYPSQPN